jgi:hypothetical protein
LSAALLLLAQYYIIGQRSAFEWTTTGWTGRGVSNMTTARSRDRDDPGGVGRLIARQKRRLRRDSNLARVPRIVLSGVGRAGERLQKLVHDAVRDELLGGARCVGDGRPKDSGVAGRE